MFTLLSGVPTWRPHTGLCKFVQNISTNIWSLGKRTDLKLREVPSLSISYKMTISQLYPLNGFRVIFILHDSASQEFSNFRCRGYSIAEAENICHIYMYAQVPKGTDNTPPGVWRKRENRVNCLHTVCRIRLFTVVCPAQCGLHVSLLWS